MGKWRAIVLSGLTLLMVIHVVQWWISGTTISPIEPSETMYTLERGVVNAGFIFFSLAILATLIFGRFVCGWACHVVALQDGSAWLLKKMGLKPRPFRSRLLVFVPLIVALYMFVWPTFARWLAKPLEAPLFPQFTNHIVTNDFWATFPTVWVAIPFLFVCGFLTVYFLGNKGFCTYACPYGGFFGVADRVAPGRIRVTDACNECGDCTAVCTSNVIVHREVKEHGMVVDPGCMKCMDCVSACPNDALYFGFGRPAVFTGKRVYGTAVATPKSKPQLSWGEEALAAFVFATSFFAVWDVYQLVPMLMALGIAAVTTFVAMRSLKLLRTQDITFYKWVLRSQGKMRVAGWLFLAFALVWSLAVEHSGYVRYREWTGLAAYSQIQMPDELALAEADPSEWASGTDKQYIAIAKKNLTNAFDAGLLVNAEVVTRLAWVEHLSGNAEQAVRMLSIAIPRQKGVGRALSLYYRGAIQNRLGRYDAALADLEAALVERSDLMAAHEEKGVALWQLGRRDEATAEWRRAADGNSVLARYMLAGAAEDEQTRSTLLADADSVAPRDAYFYWMTGLRLADLKMKQPAERNFQRAVQLDPKFILRQKPKI